MLQIFILTNIVTLVILVLVLRRMLKLRRQKNRSFNLWSYPIPKVKLNTVAPCFTANDYGITADSVVSFIGGEGVAASLTDRETWVLAGLSKSAKKIFEFGTCSGKTTHVMALNASRDTEIFTLTIHPEEVDKLLFDDKDDKRHEGVAKLEAKYVKFYYEGHPTEKKITQIFSDSKKFDESGLTGKIDLIFIDGAHTRSYVENDTNKAFKMLSPQGVIVWHDYKPDAPDVFKYLNDLSKTIELIHVKDTDLVLYRQQHG